MGIQGVRHKNIVCICVYGSHYWSKVGIIMMTGTKGDKRLCTGMLKFCVIDDMIINVAKDARRAPVQRRLQDIFGGK